MGQTERHGDVIQGEARPFGQFRIEVQLDASIKELEGGMTAGDQGEPFKIEFVVACHSEDSLPFA